MLTSTTLPRRSDILNGWPSKGVNVKSGAAPSLSGPAARVCRPKARNPKITSTTATAIAKTHCLRCTACASLLQHPVQERLVDADQQEHDGGRARHPHVQPPRLAQQRAEAVNA